VQSGELSRLAGISTDTLRHYERLGVLPKPPRTAGGYRDYAANSLERVRLIQSALKVGFSLAELATILRMRAPRGLLSGDAAPRSTLIPQKSVATLSLMQLRAP
jgi:DNA-binding transcriptional MerR regulator